ncbi:DEAD/DEAH box helicase [uncultured Litoreibacter sp.]|uniref:DEAD/DEAH box helicase n=1 Tax=uncultured Litoreibacter sp. TaxID=1392394 RepID=UPI002637C896|nr:DEAD/DEAH box helicase [uncultured Litoreibacter sp.]
MIETIARALEKREYTTLTQVQVAVTDAALEDKDLLVSAQTGSGKTVGFGLAIAPTLLGEDEKFGRAASPLALVVAPTRELALQVKRELDWLYAFAGATVVSTVGGMDMRTEKRALERGAHVVVATPGRLVDHIKRGSLDMSDIRAVVLDEADEMLDLGFREDLEFILGEAPEDRRTLMFSATVPKMIAKLAESYQKPDAVRLQTAAEKAQHSDIDYRAMLVAGNDPENAIINVLRYYEAQNAIVFCNTRATVNRLTARFSNRGFQVVALSGELSQNERTHALQAMRDGRARVCVATDVAARGIDLPNLELVIHAELPNNGETLLHRSGRTGRAGRKGTSALIVPQRFSKKAERLLQFAKVQAEWGGAPTADEVLAKDEERMFSDPVFTQEVAADETDFVTKLAATFTPEQISAAYLRLYRSRQTAPEELAAPGKREDRKPRQEFGPSQWYSISVGRNDRAEPRWLLPMLCRMGDISKDDIGAIRVQETETFVEIKQSSVDGFVKALGPDMALEEGAKLTKLDKVPEMSRPPRFDKGGKPGGKPRFDKGGKGGPKGGMASNRRKPLDKFDDDPRKAPKPKKEWKDKKPKHDPEVVADFKPKAKPADNPRYDDKPSGKPSGKPKPKYGDKPKYEGKPKYDSKPGGKPKGKPDYKSDKPKSGKPKGRPANMSDPSQSLRPRGKGKPFKGKGGDARPKRGVPKK